MAVEGKWLGRDKNILEFANNMPKEHLLAQLFHFSESYSTNEAVDKIKNVNFVAYVEKLNSEGYARLEEILPSISLPPGKVRESGTEGVTITQREMDHLKQLLEEEYDMLELLQKTLTKNEYHGALNTSFTR